MPLIIKESIEKLLEDVIQNQSTSERHRKIIELKSILKVIDSFDSLPNFKGVKNIYKLPPTGTDFSEFRIIDDLDSDDRSLWTELKGIRLSEGNLVIEIKE